MIMMRLNFLYPLNRRFLAGWVKGRNTVLSSLPFNRKAAYHCTTTPTRPLLLDEDAKEAYKTLRESQGFANDLLLSGHGEAVSPSSFHILLSLLAAGSTGWSRNHFLNFFKVNSLGRLERSVSLLQDHLFADRPDDDDGPRIRCSTSLWHDHSFELSNFFLVSLRHVHRASIFPVDFRKTPLVRQQINSRVEHDTSGLIKHLITEECLSNPSPVKLVATNTLYFKGDWDINDDKQNPNNRSGYDYNWYSDLAERFVGAEIITVGRNIFVEGGDVPCLMLGNKFRKPSEDKRHVNLTSCYPTRDTSSYSIPNETLIKVAGRETPKFKVSSEVDPSTMLRGQGILLPFSAGWLNKMVALPYSDLHRELYLFKILQKTFINSNEQGSEAATATIAIVMSGCPPHLPIPSFIDRKCYGSDLFSAANGSMARVGLQILRHV